MFPKLIGYAIGFINVALLGFAMPLDRQELADSSKSEDCQRIINRCSGKSNGPTGRKNQERSGRKNNQRTPKSTGFELEQSGIYMDIPSGKLLDFANVNITTFKNGKSTK